MASFIGRTFYCQHDFQLESVTYTGGKVASDFPAGSIEGLLRCGHVRPASEEELRAAENSLAAEETAVAEAEKRELEWTAAISVAKKKKAGNKSRKK